MPNQTRIVSLGPADRTVRAANGQILHASADWELLPPGNATLTRRVKAAGPTWTIQQKKGCKVFSLGAWAPNDRIAVSARAAGALVLAKGPRARSRIPLGKGGGYSERTNVVVLQRGLASNVKEPSRTAPRRPR